MSIRHRGGVAGSLVRPLLAGGKQLRAVLRPVRRRARIARHLLHYHPPGEQHVCPACGSASVRHLEPLTSGRKRFRFGFISGCASCGVAFANPLPTAGELETAYSPSGEWGRHRQEEQEKQVTRRRLEELFAPVADRFDVLRPAPRAAVLDFGCGLGGMLDAFAAVGWETYGIEPAMKTAFVRHRELTTIPIEPRFDLAILHHVLEHVTEPLTILRTIAAAVRPGGYVLISVPNLDDLDQHGEIKYCIRSQVHVLAYSSQCLQWIAADAGFRVVSSMGTRKMRQRVVLARREAGVKPVQPLAGAEHAFKRYFETHREDAAPLPGFPVRVRAAYADLVKAEWRLPK